MSARAAAWLAWSLCVFSLMLTALSLSLLTLTQLRPGVPINYYWLETTVIAASYSAVGAVVAPRLRQSPIGWLFTMRPRHWKPSVPSSGMRRTSTL
jgi:hypothetical protein